jgi:hypothetical protein
MWRGQKKMTNMRDILIDVQESGFVQGKVEKEKAKASRLPQCIQKSLMVLMLDG